MKATGIVWMVLLVFSGLAGWLSWPVAQQPSPARIHVENDVTDIPSQDVKSGYRPYAPYFISENRTEIFVVASESK